MTFTMMLVVGLGAFAGVSSLVARRRMRRHGYVTIRVQAPDTHITAE